MRTLHSNLVIFQYRISTLLNCNPLHFTFQSGYIPMNHHLVLSRLGYYLYIPIWLYSNKKAGDRVKVVISLYIPIWLYSNSINPKNTSSSFSFTFQSGYIPIGCKSSQEEKFRPLYIPIWLYSNHYTTIWIKKWLYFTFQSGYIPIVHHAISIHKDYSLYIPIWLYSNFWLGDYW